MKDNCKFELCPVCEFREFPLDLQLRGVCLDSPVEKFYVLHNSTELHGHGGSLFSWDDGEKTWRITSNSQSLARLQSARGERELPLGLNQWEFTHSGCSDPGNQPRQTWSVFSLMSSYERNRIIIITSSSFCNDMVVYLCFVSLDDTTRK